MKSLMQKYEIISLKKKGWSDSKISREFNVSRNTIRKYWNQYLEKEKKLLEADPNTDIRQVIEEIVEKPNYDTSHRGPLKYNEEMDLFLRQILSDEEKKTELLGKNHKQALTKRQIHQLMIDHGFNIGLTTISNKINEILDEKNETFIKQQYEFGDRFEYDFGEIKLYINNRQTKGFLAVITAPASGFRWAYLYRNMKMDVFLDSHVKFFEMVGGTFKEGVYDNMKNVVKKFIGPRDKVINDELIKLSLYYDFEINVTNCYSGNEKGSVESAVKWTRNKVFAIRYRFDTFEDAACYLQEKLAELNKASLIEDEKKHLKAYRPPYEVAHITEKLVDKYSFIHFENNCYSVPEGLCGKKVIVKAYPNELIIKYKNETIATHHRHSGKGKTYADISHYLHTLSKKPGALKNSVALKSQTDLKLIFDTYYSQKPKVFIEILRENKGKDLDEIIKALTPVQYKEDNEDKDVKVITKTDEQIKEISTLFIGGQHYVN